MLIGVDGGADALREAGYQPDLIVGDMHSVSDEALLHSRRRGGRARGPGRPRPGLERVQDLGVDAVTFPAAGTSEDIALLLADTHGADADRHRRHATPRCWSSSTGAGPAWPRPS